MSDDNDLSDEPSYEDVSRHDITADTGISKHIDNAFSIFSAERPFDVAQNDQITLGALPDSVMLRIFGNLSHPELSQVALVCKHWMWIVYDTTLWKVLDLSDRNKIDENTVIRLLQQRLSPLVKSLNLSNCCFSPTIFKELRDCTKLDTLVLQNFALKEKGEEEIGESDDVPSSNSSIHSPPIVENQLENLSIPDNLTRLDIRNVSEGYRFMHVILEGHDMSKLECFGFGNKHYCPVFTDFQTMFSKMKSLRIFECIECETFTDVQMLIIADQLNVLECLDVRKSRNVTGQSLPYLIEKIPRLKSLNLSGTGITDEAIMNTLWQCSDVEEIDFGFCDFLTGEGLADALPRMNRLRYLGLHGCGKGKALCGEALEKIHEESLWKNLEVLNLHFSIRLFEPAFPFVYHCLNLRHLSLRTCNRFGFEYIATSLRHFPCLVGFECGSLFAVKENCEKWENIILNIAEHCKQMKDLILVKCSLIPISKRAECQKNISKAFANCNKLLNVALMFTDESVGQLLYISLQDSHNKRIKLDTKATFSVIPPFKHSLDSEINQQKFMNYFGY